MRAEELYKKVLENSKAKMSAPGEMKKPTFADFGTPNNHVDGKGNETSEVKGTEASLGKRTDKKPTASVGKPGLNKDYMEKRKVPVKKVREHKALGGTVDGEMKTPTYKKDKPVRSAKVRKGDPYLKANKADPGKPKGNSPGTEKMKVAVGKVKESLDDMESFLGSDLNIDLNLSARGEGKVEID